MRAVTAAACRAGRNVIVQPSAATVKKYGVGEMLALVDSVRKNASVQVALHLDHCRDDALAIACIDAGWDAVMMDYSALPLQENIEKTRKIVDYAHRRNAAVEASGKRFPGLPAFFGTELKVIFHRIGKGLLQFINGTPLKRDDI